MASHAQRHAARVTATQAAQRGTAPLHNASAYEQMLVKLAADKRVLKGIQSNERKAQKKRELLPFWGPYVLAALQNGGGTQDAILTTVMLWRLDAGDISGALEIARYALPNRLAMPAGHHRSTACVVAEEVALAALRVAGDPVSPELLLEVQRLTSDADMPDQVRARLHKATGLALRAQAQPAAALEQLQRAMQLDSAAGVKKDLEQLRRELSPKPKVKSVPKTAPKTKKAAKTPRPRGRPKKTAD